MKTLTLIDFKSFNNKCRGWSSFYFEEDSCHISIDQTESKQFSVWLQIADRPSQGRVTETLNEAMAVANKMYLYYLNKTNAQAQTET